MTREELLQKLADKARSKVAAREDFISTLDNLISDFSDEQIATWNIIREIVELHKSEEIVWSDKKTDIYCDGCNQDYYEPYPRRTIQIIEKALL